MSHDVPDGWTPVKLGAAASNVAEKWEPGEHAEPYVGLEQVDQGTGRLLEIGVSDDLQSIKTRFRAGDVLFGKLRPNLRKTALVDFSGIASTDILVIRPTERMTPEFAFYRLSSDEAFDYAIKSAAGTKMPRTSWKDMADFEFPLPPLHEQRRIAEILSSADEAIAATRAVIEQTRKVKQGVLERLLTKGIGHTRFKQTEIGEIPEGWDVAPIEAYLARLIDYRGVPPPKSDSGVPLITAKNVRFGYLTPEPREYINEDDFDGWMRRGLPEAGDVLFTTEAPLGNVAQIPDYKIALGQRTITLCPYRTRLTPTFLKWLLLSPGSQARIAENATGSTALGIKQSTFRKLKFPFPSLDEQETIAEHIDGIDAAEAAETLKLESLNLLKAALMSDLLTGRKRVTDALPMAAE